MPVLIERRGRVAVLTMNRPEARNAMSMELGAALSNAYAEFAADDDVWAVVLTGAGDRAFSAGADLKEMGRTRFGQETGDGAPPPRPVVSGGFGGITGGDFPKPVIAAVNGFALGGGFEMALACDLVVAEEHATFGLPETKRGIVAGAGGIVRLAHRIPMPLALEMVMTGEPITAQRALEIGIANRVVPTGRGVDEAVALAEQVCAAAPLAVRLSRRVVRASISMHEEELFELQRELMRELLTSEDAREGVMAFAEKRAPQWQAR